MLACPPRTNHTAAPAAHRGIDELTLKKKTTPLEEYSCLARVGNVYRNSRDCTTSWLKKGQNTQLTQHREEQLIGRDQHTALH
jgi:hypothetical protein